MDEQALKDFVNTQVDKKLEGRAKDFHIQTARDIRNNTHTDLTVAVQRTCELSDEFARLEVQIATILFAFASLFINTETLKYLSTSSYGGQMKFAFAFALAFLLLSLVFGMIHIKRRDMFWLQTLGQRILRFDKWSDAAQGVTSFEEAQAFHIGTNLNQGLFLKTPDWPWVLQTICLAISVAILYVLALVFLFT